MEEIEVPLDAAQEEIHKGAHEAGGWLRWAALASAILAALAAVAALISGHFANEAMLEQIKASDKWSQYQAKSIKSSLAEARLEQLAPDAATELREKLSKKIEKYGDDRKEIQEAAEGLEKISEIHLSLHETTSRAVTFFQVSIAIAAISVLARRRRYLLVSLGSGLIGIGFLAQALLFFLARA
jgi:succinate dehydrogenase/fumarate reductase flavoprotein subunit